MTESKYINCPFCGESGFDLWGLKYGHLMPGWCPIYEGIKEDYRLFDNEDILKRIGKVTND